MNTKPLRSSGAGPHQPDLDQQLVRPDRWLANIAQLEHISWAQLANSGPH